MLAKNRRARAAAAGPGLWKLCEQQSRRQVRGLIDFRHPLSSPAAPPPPAVPPRLLSAHPSPRAGHIAPKQNASRPTNRRVHRFRKIRPDGGCGGVLPPVGKGGSPSVCAPGVCGPPPPSPVIYHPAARGWMERERERVSRRL